MKKYEAMVLSCMDPRFQLKVFNYLKKKKLTGKYSSFTIAGSAIGVTSKKFKKWQSTFLDNFDYTKEQSEEGYKNFTVIQCKIKTIEWLYLAAKGHRRARFDIDNSKDTWLVP